MIVLRSGASVFKCAPDRAKFQYSHKWGAKDMSSLYKTKSDRPSSGRDLSFSDEDYSRLRNIANVLIRREMTNTLTATGLVHEWFLKSIKSRFSPHERVEELNESSQFRYASRNMKQILIDRARSRISRQKSERGATHSLVDNSTLLKLKEADEFIVALEDALLLMQATMPENSQLVRLRVFEGKSIEESAEILGMARATAFRKWSFCKVWLASRLDCPV
jgi:RNA polymerase sigma factor (TIGR02999 family)